MPRTTTQQGLGKDHQRRRALMAPPAGDPCPYCTKPMWPDQPLDADHVVARTLGGVDGPLRWAHASCNRRAGGQMGHDERGIRSRVW